MKNVRILMLEADPDDAKTIAEALGSAGIDLEYVRVEARLEFEARLRELKPDIVLSDYWLPDMDGLSALSMTMEKSPGVPFIFVSGAMGEDLAIDAVKRGAADYVLKVDLSRLAPAVHRALREAEEREERILAEARIIESEGRLRKIIESVATGVLIVDPETHKIVDANKAALQMVGSSRDRVVGKLCYRLACPAGKGECPVTDLGHVLDRSEVLLRRAGGETLTVLKTVTPMVLDGREYLLESFVDITAKMQMEEALRDSEETARTLLNVPIGSSLMIDTSGNLIAINERGAEILGKSAEELLGSNLLDLLPDNMTEERRKRVGEVVRTGAPLRYEDEMDGMYFDNYLFPLFGSTGKVNRVVIFAQDMTERKMVEEAQKSDRDFISKVIDTAGALVVVREAQGRVVLFNRTAEESTGYRLAEVAGKRLWDVLVDPKDAGHSRVVFQELLAGEETGGYEERWCTKEGERRLISLSSATLAGADGEVEYVITTGIDISESKRAEEMLKESEERYRTVFESTGTAMCIVDRAATITFLNQEFARMTGYGAEEMVGKGNFIDLMTVESAESFREYHQGLLKADQDSPIHFECNLHARDGTVLNMLANMGFMPGLDATAVSLIDITREKAYEEDLKERAERLRDFLVVASHELRHPITIVKGYASILSAHIDQMPREQVHDLLKDVSKSTDRLTRYVEQLLDISRIEQGRVLVEKQSVDPGKLVETAVGDQLVVGCGNELIVRVRDHMENAQLDPEKFVQLLNILLDNAIKFSPADSPVEIDTEREGDMMVVSVLDRGDGIPEKSREWVFDRFYQVEDAAHHSKIGLGLGLYIAQQIAEAHGGSIWVEPRQGGGSIFRFTVNVGRSDGEQP